MTFEKFWQAIVARNSRFEDPDHVASIKSSSLRDLCRQAHEQGVRRGRESKPIPSLDSILRDIN